MVEVGVRYRKTEKDPFGKRDWVELEFSFPFDGNTLDREEVFPLLENEGLFDAREHKLPRVDYIEIRPKNSKPFDLKLYLRGTRKFRSLGSIRTVLEPLNS